MVNKLTAVDLTVAGPMAKGIRPSEYPALIYLQYRRSAHLSLKPRKYIPQPERGCPTLCGFCKVWARGSHRQELLACLRCPRDRRTAPILWRAQPALHHLQLVWAQPMWARGFAPCMDGAEPRPCTYGPFLLAGLLQSCGQVHAGAGVSGDFARPVAVPSHAHANRVLPRL